ncbi:MAG: hypothetical protein AB1489_15595 [Acidobacteriota bacterium]
MAKRKKVIQRREIEMRFDAQGNVLEWVRYHDQLVAQELLLCANKKELI